ncbi:efflux RND transporter permease subunit [Colwellia sp. Bg11-28]|uniref:efflux RND transporter permease subunit n=1 Tax=Colwellia sp. Bg11-28 TaxID=2058305 RepID=UPI000C340D63|nr:efflux RND transporter permease subunit [Colwellia sp. Bg11-28]PKH85424.1 acriflavin resistance protein [Colwellia sp. Bg11-28]
MNEIIKSNVESNHKGIIAYFINNPILSNLMMVFIIVIGLLSYFNIQKQMFPNIEINKVHIEVSYPGASPQEIEESILIKIEESIKGITEIKRGVSKSYRGSGSIVLEIDPQKELSEILDKIKYKVDSISVFPADMEPITIYQAEFQQDVIQMSLVGDQPLNELKPLAKKIEDELLQLKNVSLVDLNIPEDEISIEIKPNTLRKYGLSFDDVKKAINKYSANTSAGQLRTDVGIISVRVQNQFYEGKEFRHIPVKIGDNGSKVLLQDIAVINDGFVEGERYFKHSGHNAVYISIKATADQDMTLVAQSVHDFIALRNKNLPKGIELKTIVDMTYYLNARLDMMLMNLVQGAILVALILSLFLRFKLAMWVMVGLPVCFFGAIMVMPFLGVSLNIVSLFAFIMVLGIVVDDATVIGESIYTEIQNKESSGVDSVIIGVNKVVTPATFGVLTTIAVFAPFTLSNGPDSSFFYGISVVVILCLIFSLIESKLILPAHIAQTDFSKTSESGWRVNFNNTFNAFINGPYRQFLKLCLEWRWLVFSCFIALLIISLSLISASYIRTVPTPKVPHDFPVITLEMNDNVSDQQTIDALKAIESVVLQSDQRINNEFGQSMIKDLLLMKQGRTEAQLVISLIDEVQRPFDTFELSRRWREIMPEIAGVKSISIQDDVNGPKKEGEFGYLLYGSDIHTLNTAGRQLISNLQQEKGLYDIGSSIDPASKEIQILLLPVAYDLGIDLAAIAHQMGSSFYGGEVQRIIRDGEEVRVMVRYPKSIRKAFSSLKHAIITLSDGKKVMLGDVATLKEVPGISYIRREGGSRTVYIYGAIDEGIVEPNKIITIIEDKILVALKEDFPNVKTELGGSIEERQAQNSEQVLFFILGMLIVYMLLAVPLKSYTQPIIIMSIIPFSLTGAVWGHFFFGLDLSIMSFFGIIAAAGVVINDSLVMADFINQKIKQGESILNAVVDGGCARFRAIFLTSITTFFGVLPIMFETSLQAKFVIPMAVSLGFSVLFAAIVTLVLVPCFYVMEKDISTLLRRIVCWLKAIPYAVKSQDLI